MPRSIVTGNVRLSRHLRIAIAAIALIAPLQFAVAGQEGDEESLKQAIAESDAAIQAEITKSAVVSKSVAEGLESYRQQVKLQNAAVDLQEALAQPNTMCQVMGSQDALGSGQRNARTGVMYGQKLVRATSAQNTNTLAVLNAAHQSSNTKFCTDEEITRGICLATVVPGYSNLSGADQNALFLFQSRSGYDTYEGSRDGAQFDAVNKYITRVVYGVAPPEQLKAVSKASYQKNPQARAYVELQRRYDAFLSMAAYSLNSIKESRNAAK